MSDSSPPNDQEVRARSLAVLRAMIDTIDRDVLQLLSRRYALVSELAQHKREQRLPIRDAQREREIIQDRRQRAGTLGLPPDMVESLFRLVLWASRDRQAALKAELPSDIEPRTVAVIGGNGRMGRCLLNLFADLGHTVMSADLDTRSTPEEAAAGADVVIVSVPIEATVDVIRRLGPLVRQDALMMDVTSIKSAPLAAMLECCGGSVVGAHPLFGPSVHSLQGQRVVLCRGRGDDWFEWVRRMFQARGLAILEATAEAHDRAMSVVQVLVHFATEVMGQTLAKLDVSLDETLAFTSPVYLMELIMTGRHFAQSPDLYASIQMFNPDTPQVTAAFEEAARRLRAAVVDGDREAFNQMFTQVRDYFGPFTEQALEQSSFLIDRLVERS